MEQLNLLTFHCAECHDLGLTLLKGCLGHCACSITRHANTPAAKRTRTAIISLPIDRPIDPFLFLIARTLIRTTADTPVSGAQLRDAFNISERSIKNAIRRLRDEWHLPVCASRDTPAGYFIAATPGEFLSWFRPYKSQAISELATGYRLFKANFPELAGQANLFAADCAHDLQEAIK